MTKRWLVLPALVLPLPCALVVLWRTGYLWPIALTFARAFMPNPGTEGDPIG